MIEILNQLEAAKTINEKIIILLGLWESKQFGFFHGTKLGLDRKFDLKLTSAPLIDEDDDFEGTFDFPSFQILIQQLQMNPEDSSRLLNEAAEKCSARIWNHFYRKILLRRITWLTRKEFNTILSRIEVSDARANQFTVEEWQPQQTVNGSTSDLRGEFFLEPHIEGNRQLIYVYADGTIRILNEDGTQSPLTLETNVDWPTSFVLDTKETNGVFWVTDFILMDQFDNNNCDMPLLERSDVLNQMIGLFQDKLPSLRILPKVEFSGDFSQRVQEVRKQYVEEGYTHAVVKPLQSRYSRSKTDWKLIKLL